MYMFDYVMLFISSILTRLLSFFCLTIHDNKAMFHDDPRM